MRKIIFTVAVCLFITAVLLVIGFCDFPLKALTLSLVSTAMFIGFAFLLRAVNPKMSARRFFSLRGIRFADIGVIFWSTVVIVSGTFLLNVATSLFCDAVGLESTVSKLSSMNEENYLFVLITVAILPAFTEEFFFRGAVLSSLEGRGILFSVLMTSALFTVMHGLDIYFLPTFFAGLVLAFVVRVSKSVFAAAAVHMINNILSYILWRYATRLFAVKLEAVMIYAAVIALLTGALFIVSSAIRRLKKDMYRKCNILNEGEIVWAKNQDGQEKKS